VQVVALFLLSLALCFAAYRLARNRGNAALVSPALAWLAHAVVFYLSANYGTPVACGYAGNVTNWSVALDLHGAFTITTYIILASWCFPADAGRALPGAHYNKTHKRGP
jgi:hypothetical protein